MRICSRDRTEFLTGVGHLIFLSITSLGKPEVTKFSYYAAKAAQEKLMCETDLPTLVVNSAQRMEFVLNPASSSEEDDTVEVENCSSNPSRLPMPPALSPTPPSAPEAKGNEPVLASLKARS